jgi:hypothetical protein
MQRRSQQVRAYLPPRTQDILKARYLHFSPRSGRQPWARYLRPTALFFALPFARALLLLAAPVAALDLAFNLALDLILDLAGAAFFAAPALPAALGVPCKEAMLARVEAIFGVAFAGAFVVIFVAGFCVRRAERGSMEDAPLFMVEAAVFMAEALAFAAVLPACLAD